MNNPRTPFTLPSLLASLVAVFTLTACGVSPADVGGQCTGDQQCSERCLRDDNYPGGYCTLPCNSDAQCPNGTVCLDEEGGICVFTCRESRDCDRFGREWTCQEQDRRGADGRASVCRVN